MNLRASFVLFSVAEQYCAIRILDVDRVIRVVDIKPIPQNSLHILGLINFHGTMVPVSNLHQYFSELPRDLNIKDKIIIVREEDRLLAFLVQRVHGMIVRDESELTALSAVIPNANSTVSTFKDGIYLIQNFSSFFKFETCEV